MNNLTRGNVAYNFHYSPYYLDVNYDDEVLTFVFSSKFNLERFRERIESNREVINASLTKRFRFTIVNNVLCDLRLYISIEKRGFLVKTNKDVFECPDSIILDGNNQIMQK